LAPNPQLLPCSGAVTRNPLNTFSNEVPALVNDEVSPKPPARTKKQRLTSYDTNEIMVSFAASNQQSENAFQDYMWSKMETEKEKAAIEKQKQASSAISNKEFKLFKNT